MLNTAERSLAYRGEDVTYSYEDTDLSADDVAIKRKQELAEVFAWVFNTLVTTSHISARDSTGLHHIAPYTETTTGRDPDDLVEALMDLHWIKPEAERDGKTGPSGNTIALAERILRALYSRVSQEYGVYPMYDGDIAIDVPSPPGTKLLVICDANGSARCIGFYNDRHSVREYPNPDVLPDRAFMNEWHRVLEAFVSA